MLFYADLWMYNNEYLVKQIEPQLLLGKNVMIAAHGNSLRSIIMYLDKLTSQEVQFFRLNYLEHHVLFVMKKVTSFSLSGY